MKNPFTLIGLIIGAGLLYNALPLARQVYGRYRLRRLVTCPETEALAEVNTSNSGATNGSISPDEGGLVWYRAR